MFVISKYSVGGAEKQLANLIAYRPERARGVEVHTITFEAPLSREVARRFEEAGAHNTLIDRQQLGFARFMLRLVRTMWRLRPVVVSTLLDSSVGAWGRLAAWLTRVPVIVHSDRLLVTEGTRAHYLLRPFLDRVTHRFLPNAHAIEERLVADGVPRDRIRVMPNGVELDVFHPSAVIGSRGSWGIGEEAVVLGYLGRIAPLKRVDLLLRAVLRLDERERPDRIVVAGSGESAPQVEAMVQADPWLRDHCRLLGSIDDTPSFLASIDYLVLPSESEGLPNVVLEAMAMRKPVVATAVSDVPVLVADTGFLARPGDESSLVDALRAIQALSRDERRALGQQARVRVEREYAMSVRAERFWDAHLELMPPSAARELDGPAPSARPDARGGTP